MMRKWFHEYIEIPIWQTALCQELLGQGLFPPSNRKDSLSQVLSHNSVLFFFNSACKVVLVVKNLPANSGNPKDMGLTPRSRRSSGEGNGNPLQYSCLEYSMDRGAWWATVHWVTKSLTRLKQLSMYVLD